MLSREEVERIENTLERNLKDFEIHGGMVRYWASMNDAKKLLREYRAVMAERGELAAEGLVLREALEAVAGDMDKAWLWPSTKEAVITALQLDTTLIAAEVERVKRLEAVAEAAEALYDDYCQEHPQWQRLLRDTLFAALAAWREGEG